MGKKERDGGYNGRSKRKSERKDWNSHSGWNFGAKVFLFFLIQWEESAKPKIREHD